MLALLHPVQSVSGNLQHINCDTDVITASTPVDEPVQVDSCSVTIPFQPQKYNWDCGLACCCMILRYLGKDERTVYSKDVERLQCSHSVWTIHLAYLLKYHGVRAQLFTITLGADKTYAEQKFYQNYFHSDEVKINQLFENAHRNGVQVTKQSVELRVILQHISLGNILICLLDALVLTQNIFSEKCGQLSCFRDRCSSYQGHYIVVCGYNKTKQQILYRNPGLNRDEVSSCSWKTFDAARKRYGTDEDLLFIYTSRETLWR